MFESHRKGCTMTMERCKKSKAIFRPYSKPDSAYWTASAKFAYIFAAGLIMLRQSIKQLIIIDYQTADLDDARIGQPCMHACYHCLTASMLHGARV